MAEMEYSSPGLVFESVLYSSTANAVLGLILEYRIAVPGLVLESSKAVLVVGLGFNTCRTSVR